jgi:hypothetical protein
MTFLPPHTKRLAQLVNRPGGLTVNEAVAAAEGELIKLRDRGLSEIDETIGAMQKIADAFTQTQAKSAREELYSHANFLIGVGGVFERTDIGEVARSLCALMEVLMVSGSWDRAAVQLHLDSLRLASREDVSRAETEMVTAALRQVVAKAAAR